MPDFDPSEYLKDEDDIAIYLTIVIEENDPSLLAAALGDIARARGMSEVARDAGITREALYKALRPNASPRFETISKVCMALGVKLEVVPIRKDSPPLHEEHNLIPANTSTQLNYLADTTSNKGSAGVLRGGAEVLRTFFTSMHASIQQPA